MKSQPIDAAYLRANPLPNPGESGDNHSRGKVLVVAGSVMVPGAALLAGAAALRAGAGVLQIATCRSHAAHLAVAMPEAMVIGCPETKSGEIDPSNVPRLAELAKGADAVLLGPGLMDEAAVGELRTGLLRQVPQPVYVLDASAFTSLRIGKEISNLQGRRVIVTPHAGEMATFLGSDKKEIERDSLSAAETCARTIAAVVVMKGGRTYVASPQEAPLCFAHGPIALGTSGSGDVLAGLIAGMAARGAGLAAAAAWAVYLHGEAGRRWVERHGRLGLLAREIADGIPSLMQDFEIVPST